MTVRIRQAAFILLLALGGATRVAAQSADLNVAKTDSPDPVLVGTNLTYTITVTNAGPNAAANAALTDILPANTTFVSLTSPGGWTATTPPVGGTGTVSATNPSVASGLAQVFTLVVNVNIGTPPGTTLSNTASATSTTPEPNPTNNSDTEATAPQGVAADLGVTKTDTPDPVATGANLTYAIRVINNGPNPATNLHLSDVVPTNTTLVSVTAPAGWTVTTQPAQPDGGTVIVAATLPTLAINTPQVFTLVVRVNPATPGGTTISNSAFVISGNVDPNPANNSATETTGTSGLSADLAVAKTDSPDPVLLGNNLTYTVTATNAGPDAATSVALTDVLPADTTFVSFAFPAGWTVTTPPVGGTGTVSATSPNVASGLAQVFTLVVNVNSGTPQGTTLSNSASATSTTPDPNPANNSDTETTAVTTPVPTLAPMQMIVLAALLLMLALGMLRARTGGSGPGPTTM